MPPGRKSNGKEQHRASHKVNLTVKKATPFTAAYGEQK